MKRLTQKQHQFALAYLETGNRVEAYRRAYNHGRMTERTVSRKAQEVAALPHVAAEVARLRAARSERTQITADWVLKRWAALASPGIEEDVPAAVRKSALDSIAKHLGMFEKQLPQPDQVLINLNMGQPPPRDPPKAKRKWRTVPLQGNSAVPSKRSLSRGT